MGFCQATSETFTLTRLMKSTVAAGISVGKSEIDGKGCFLPPDGFSKVEDRGIGASGSPVGKRRAECAAAAASDLCHRLLLGP